MDVAQLNQLIKEIEDKREDPLSALDEPHLVIWCTVLDALKMFQRITGKPPRLLELPPMMEAAMNIYVRKNCKPKLFKPLRKIGSLAGVRMVFDADAFDIDS
jgi:hypothetical protein